MHPRPRIPLWLDGSQEGEDPEELEAARKLIMSAVQAPLLPAQQQEVRRSTAVLASVNAFEDVRS